MAPLLAEFPARYPRLDAELVIGDRYVNLVDEGFDLAIRVGLPTDTGKRGRKLADSERCLVASRDYLETHGLPRTPKDLERHGFVFQSELGTSATWRFRKGHRSLIVPGTPKPPVPRAGGFNLVAIRTPDEVGPGRDRVEHRDDRVDDRAGGGRNIAAEPGKDLCGGLKCHFEPLYRGTETQ